MLSITTPTPICATSWTNVVGYIWSYPHVALNYWFYENRVALSLETSGYAHTWRFSFHLWEEHIESFRDTEE